MADQGCDGIEWVGDGGAGEGEVRTKSGGGRRWGLNMLLVLQRLFKSDAEGMKWRAERRRENRGQHCG